MKNRYFRVGAALLNLAALLVVIFNIHGPVPVHFDFNMSCDRMGSAWLLLVPALLPLLLAFGDLLPGSGAREGRSALKLILTVLEFLMIGFGWLMAALMLSGVQPGERAALPFPGAICLLLGAAMMVICNYTPLLPQNRRTGYRTRKTLSDADAWKRAQRIQGRWGMLGGLAMAAFGVAGLLTGSGIYAAIGILLGIALLAGVPAILIARDGK